MDSDGIIDETIERMTFWFQGLILVLALLTGAATGWAGGRAVGMAMPNALVATAVLVVGSLGGPAITYTVLGSGRTSFALALFIAGFATGTVFWPMGERQGTQRWL